MPVRCISAFSSGSSGLVRGLLNATERQDRGCGGVDTRMHPECTDRRPKNFAFEDAEGGGVAWSRLRLQSCGPGRLLGRLLGFEQAFERVLRTILACQRAIGAPGAGPDGSSGPSWSVLQTFACISMSRRTPPGTASSLVSSRMDAVCTCVRTRAQLCQTGPGTPGYSLAVETADQAPPALLPAGGRGRISPPGPFRTGPEHPESLG